MTTTTCKVCGKRKIPDTLFTGRRLGMRKSCNIPDWFMGWSPRNSNAYDEGTWEDWVNLAHEILAVDEELTGQEVCECLAPDWDYD